ncbi:MAG: hypothetical protein IKZ31_01050 [Lentisphaeria bacterium]|nr:hypothetical protein [Lentisphaeria bacterium]
MYRYHSSAASISTPPKKELPGKNGFPVEISPGCNIAHKNQITSFFEACHAQKYAVLNGEITLAKSLLRIILLSSLNYGGSYGTTDC